MAEYECVFKVGEARPPMDQEIKILMRNPDTMEMFHARVIVHRSFQEHPDADKLYYTSAIGGREKEPLPIEILEVLTEETEEVKPLARQKLTLGERKGKMLSDMIKERQDKKK